MKGNLKTFLLAGIPFSVTMGALIGILHNPLIGLWAACLLGTIFGLAISTFVHIQSKKFKNGSSQTTGKSLMEGAANHFKGAESVGVWLSLTSEQLVFISHDFNVQKHQTVIPLTEIIEIKPSLTLGFVPNGMQIITISGKEKFVVNKRNEWIKEITSAQNKASK